MDNEPITKLIDQLISVLKSYKDDKILGQLLQEALWLKQEISIGRLKLPLKSTQDLFLPYALSEYVLPAEIKRLAEQISDQIFN